MSGLGSDYPCRTGDNAESVSNRSNLLAEFGGRTAALSRDHLQDLSRINSWESCSHDNDGDVDPGYYKKKEEQSLFRQLYILSKNLSDTLKECLQTYDTFVFSPQRNKFFAVSKKLLLRHPEFCRQEKICRFVWNYGIYKFIQKRRSIRAYLREFSSEAAISDSDNDDFLFQAFLYESIGLARRLNPIEAHTWHQMQLVVHDQSSPFSYLELLYFEIRSVCCPFVGRSYKDSLQRRIDSVFQSLSSETPQHPADKPPASMCLKLFLYTLTSLLCRDGSFSAAAPHMLMFCSSLREILSMSFRPNPLPAHTEGLSCTNLFQMAVFCVYATFALRNTPGKEDEAAFLCLNFFLELSQFTAAFVAQVNDILNEPKIIRCSNSLLGVLRVFCMWWKSEYTEAYMKRQNDNSLAEKVWLAYASIINYLYPLVSAQAPLKREFADCENMLVVLSEDVELLGCTALDIPRFHVEPLNITQLTDGCKTTLTLTHPSAFSTPFPAPLQINDSNAGATLRLRTAHLILAAQHCASSPKPLLFLDDKIEYRFFSRVELEKRNRARRSDLMLKLGSLHQRHLEQEMSMQLEQLRVKAVLILVVTGDEFLSYPDILNKLVDSKQYIIAVPTVALDRIDQLKTGEDNLNRAARKANRLLRKWQERQAQVYIQERNSVQSVTKDSQYDEIPSILRYAKDIAAKTQNPPSAVSILTSDQKLIQQASQAGYSTQTLPSFRDILSSKS